MEQNFPHDNGDSGCISAAEWFLNKTCKTFLRLRRRKYHGRLSKRICFLAKPRIRHHRKSKSKITTHVCSKRKIEIVRLEERKKMRLEQLAYPLVRRLIENRDAFKNVYDPRIYYTFNRHIRRSLFSLYSRLANIQAPQKPVRPEKWTAKDWKIHTRKLRKLAKPKPGPKAPEQGGDYMPLGELLPRIRELATPKKIYEHIPHRKNYAGKYKASPRILQLAKRPDQPDDVHYKNPLEINALALTAKPTARTKELAMHKKIALKHDTDKKDNPWQISPNALKAKPSERTKELAKPKEYEEPPIRKDPFKISPNALKAKTSERTALLAKPKSAAQ